jgi:hypothetical protein
MDNATQMENCEIVFIFFLKNKLFFLKKSLFLQIKALKSFEYDK